MNANDKTSWLAGLISGWGIKEVWAKIIAGAIIGALGAAGFLTSCTQQQLQDTGRFIHDAYHAATDEPCVFERVEQEGK